jgi:hypothetical protein
LNKYIGTPLTSDFTELLGKIMAQTLSILALSTKMMTEGWMSESIDDPSSFLSDYGSEKFRKKLIGRTEAEDGLLRLDSLTKEESLMAVATILEVADRVEGNVEQIKVFAESTDCRVQEIERVTHNVGQTVKAVEERMQSFLSPFTHVLTLFPIAFRNRNEWRTTFVTPRSLAVHANTLFREPDPRETSNMALPTRFFHQP